MNLDEHHPHNRDGDRFITVTSVDIFKFRQMAGQSHLRFSRLNGFE